MGVDELLAAILRLPREDLERLLATLRAADPRLERHNATLVDIAPGQERRLVEENGYLVAEAFPGEEPIRTEEVKRILDGMEW